MSRTARETEPKSMGLISYIMGGDSRKSLKKLNKTALEVEKREPKYQAMSDAELQRKFWRQS